MTWLRKVQADGAGVPTCPSPAACAVPGSLQPRKAAVIAIVSIRDSWLFIGENSVAVPRRLAFLGPIRLVPALPFHLLVLPGLVFLLPPLFFQALDEVLMQGRVQARQERLVQVL